MRIFTAILVGVVSQLLARYYFDGTPAEGYIAYLIGALFGYVSAKKDKPEANV